MEKTVIFTNKSEKPNIFRLRKNKKEQYNKSIADCIQENSGDYISISKVYKK